MNDLIDREELKKAAKRIESLPWGDEEGNRVEFQWSPKELESLIDKAPSAEPEIIRCKDCKNYYPDEDGRGYHCERDSNVRFSVHKDFYCADAERRTDE